MTVMHGGTVSSINARWRFPEMAGNFAARMLCSLHPAAAAVHRVPLSPSAFIWHRA
jgi:hypothetical protein